MNRDDYNNNYNFKPYYTGQPYSIKILGRHNGKSTMELIYLIRTLPKEQQQILFNKLKELLGERNNDNRRIKKQRIYKNNGIKTSAKM